MTTYLRGIAAGAGATILLAFILKALTGLDFIGYSPVSRVIVGAICGTIIAALAGLPRLIDARLGCWYVTVISAAGSAWILWILEILLMPQSNAGFSLHQCLMSLSIGSYVGLALFIAAAIASGRGNPTQQG